MARRSTETDATITIKKYANRRLYNTGSSSYITLDDLAKMTREGVQFKVVDAKSGEDITHSILTQIIMDEEANGAQLLPVSFLRDLISMYGNSMQAMMPSYLEASMKNFRENQAKICDAFQAGTGTNPLTKIAETNIAVMRAMGAALIPGNAAPPKSGKQQDDDQIAALRDQMAEMQKKLDQLDK